METDFPALEVRQLEEEPVRRKLAMAEEGGGGGDRVYQGRTTRRTNLLHFPSL